MSTTINIRRLERVLKGELKAYSDLTEHEKDNAYNKWAETVEPDFDRNSDEFMYFAGEYVREGYDIIASDFDYSIGSYNGSDFVIFSANVDVLKWLDSRSYDAVERHPDFYELRGLTEDKMDAFVYISKQTSSMCIKDCEIYYDEEIDFDQERAENLIEEIAEEILSDAQDKAESIRISLFADFEYQFSRECFEDQMDGSWETLYFNEEGRIEYD